MIGERYSGRRIEWRIESGRSRGDWKRGVVASDFGVQVHERACGDGGLSCGGDGGGGLWGRVVKRIKGTARGEGGHTSEGVDGSECRPRVRRQGNQKR